MRGTSVMKVRGEKRRAKHEFAGNSLSNGSSPTTSTRWLSATALAVVVPVNPEILSSTE